ncbi:MAG: hypothetical protein E6G92_07855 [Alphaproteobacteria bacterium]|nr:MAG: hypothetical protein E6G92_07855 [Alphaproteobacteria bacterium]
MGDQVVGAGTLFSYLSAFVTIVLALALSDLLISLHRLLRRAHAVKWAALPVAAALLVLLLLISEFFSIWSMTVVDRVSFGGLVVLLLPNVFVFLAASAVLPDEVGEEGIDLGRFYFENRLYFYLTLACALAADAPRAAMAGEADLAGLLLDIALPTVLIASLFVAMALSERRWLHWTGLAIAYALISLNFTAQTIAAPAAIVGQG